MELFLLWIRKNVTERYPWFLSGNGYYREIIEIISRYGLRNTYANKAFMKPFCYRSQCRPRRLHVYRRWLSSPQLVTPGWQARWGVKPHTVTILLNSKSRSCELVSHCLWSNFAKVWERPLTTPVDNIRLIKFWPYGAKHIQNIKK